MNSAPIDLKAAFGTLLKEINQVLPKAYWFLVHNYIKGNQDDEEKLISLQQQTGLTHKQYEVLLQKCGLTVGMKKMEDMSLRKATY